MSTDEQTPAQAPRRSGGYLMVHRDLWEQLKESRAELKASAEALREALTPSGETKAAYMGEFQFRFPMVDDDGEEYSQSINVPWTTIKKIMAAIRARAALAGKEPGQ